MATTMRAGDVTLHDLGARFGLQLVKDATFFPEWTVQLSIADERRFSRREIDSHSSW